ncbi:MAG: type II secretion system protein [Patescibacteria group bacterium]
MKKGGFTLIEMLVVVAVIGILASVTLVALGPSRAKARDARIISAVSQARLIAEASFNGSSYVLPETGGGNAWATINAISTGNALQRISSDITSSGGTAGLHQYRNEMGTLTMGVMYAANLNSGGWWCVDTNGVSRQETGTISGSVFGCP